MLRVTRTIRLQALVCAEGLLQHSQFCASMLLSSKLHSCLKAHLHMAAQVILQHIQIYNTRGIATPAPPGYSFHPLHTH